MDKKLFIQRHHRLILTALAVITIAGALFCVTIGRYAISFPELMQALFDHMNGIINPDNETADSVIFNIRLPRVVLAVALGSGLACAGAAFQSLFSNPLATPDTLGVTSGASVGAVIAMLLDSNMITVQVVALLFGLGSVALTVSVARIQGKTSIVMLVLSGVIISAVFSAIISLLKYTADPLSKLPEITYWLMGSLAGKNFESLAFGLPFIIVGIVAIYALRWRLNILSLSEDEARASGTNVQRIRLIVVIASTMITASCVSMCGQVGWVGLLVPHCARMICGNNNVFVIPFSVILGAIFVLAIDTIARTVLASEIPISILTALIGAPFFIVLLRQTKGGWQ